MRQAMGHTLSECVRPINYRTKGVFRARTCRPTTRLFTRLGITARPSKQRRKLHEVGIFSSQLLRILRLNLETHFLNALIFLATSNAFQ